ncbi:OmpA family protein [Paracoccus sp. Z330]|uniref:OmpA family protein n=1 Tax=Paracoccus onchidii TaxID=3017813 RepID=A0ABT4ZH85_9RHOB|nr:OmpA family protein [Paracoccus onchidii]MDB6178719.1 OmpA family protein [Paracoccus onchidii]
MLPVMGFAQDIGTVNFQFDSDQLDAEGRQQVEAIAQKLIAAQSYKPSVVIGYTDAVGSNAYNLDLGRRRAQTVANALIALGAPVDRIDHVESRGENELLVNVATAQRSNRRVTVTLDDMLAACRSYREIQLSQSNIGASLEQDLRQKLATAVQQYQSFAATGGNGPAYQMAGAAREDCGIAVGFDGGASRKLEYSKRCLCSYARLSVAMGG